MNQHYNPIVYHRLQQLFEIADWEALVTYLDSLSHSQFRTAGYLIGERLLTNLSAESFWEVVKCLILWQPKAFTVMMAKAAAIRLQDGTLTIHDDGFVRLATALQGESHAIDRQKLLMQWLPYINEPTSIEELFSILGVDNPRRRTDFLLRTNTIAAAFVLLRTLRFEEHDREYLTSVCRQLIHRASTLSHSTGHADSLSFNLASLLCSYFDLPDIRGSFSLALHPYELSRLDTDFDTFRHLITKV